VLPLAPCFWGAYSWAVKMRAIKSQQRGECLTKVLTSSFEVRGEGVRADLEHRFSNRDIERVWGVWGVWEVWEE
jgi:hypothetical protein